MGLAKKIVENMVGKYEEAEHEELKHEHDDDD